MHKTEVHAVMLALGVAFFASACGDHGSATPAIGRLLAFLDSRRDLSRTAVIVTADHGESLGDHGEQSHGIFIYQSVLHVPLIVRWPGIAPRRVTELVRLIDLAPTILAVEHIAAPPMDGSSLIPLLTGARHLELDGYAESMYPVALAGASCDRFARAASS